MKTGVEPQFNARLYDSAQAVGKHAFSSGYAGVGLFLVGIGVMRKDAFTHRIRVCVALLYVLDRQNISANG